MAKDKVQADCESWLDDLACGCVDRQLRVLLTRLEREAEELLAMGVPEDQLTRLIDDRGNQRIVPDRTDWVGE